MLAMFLPGRSVAQSNGAVYIDPNRGAKAYRKSLVMNRNKVESIMGNWGTFGRVSDPMSGVWPSGSGHGHVHEMTILVGGQVVGAQGQDLHIISESYSEFSDRAPDNKEYWWNPLPGYANEHRRLVDPASGKVDTASKVASSVDLTTWPQTWPGKDPSWDGHWFGYFGKDQYSADQEAMYVMDDSYNSEFPYYPFVNDTTRRGLGLQVEARLFQWSHPLAEDQIFIHFQVSNVSDYDYDKHIYFGAFADTHPGGLGASDDNSGFDRGQNMVYAWDNDNVSTVWTKYKMIPPGYLGWKYLESPGMGNDKNGVGGDGVDNDGDGLLDESRDNDAGTWVFGSVGTYGPQKWHWSGDEDGDWVLETDDVGTDGIGPLDPAYIAPDPNGTEGNGKPDQGEPNFGITDNDESDQIGLTSFYSPAYGSVQVNDDERIWNYIQPGVFETPAQNANNMWVFASGPFDLKKMHTERFSVCWMFGNDLREILRNAQTSQKIYDDDYRFTKPPLPPTVRAVAGDKKVTLYWDDLAERSYDPIYGYDFEGYKIYRGTNPQLTESQKITDAYGSVVYRLPIAQFDLNDGVKGLHPMPLGAELGDQYSTGIHYNMGEDTGLRHYFEDTNVENGVTYYYVVNSYDKGYYTGMDDRGLVPMTPSESPFDLTVEYGELVSRSFNTTIVAPNAPATNYVAGTVNGSTLVHGSGNATGTVHVDVIDPDKLADNHVYELSFDTKTGVETGIGIPFATSYILRDTTVGTTLLSSVNVPLKAAVKDTESVGKVFEWQKYDSAWTSNIFTGMVLRFVNAVPSIATVKQASCWKPGSNTTCDIAIDYGEPLNPFVYPVTFQIEITDTVSGKSFSTQQATATFDTFFRIVNTVTGDVLPCYLKETLFTKNGKWDKNERLYIGLKQSNGTYLWPWVLDLVVFPESVMPKAGDVYNFRAPIPFTSADKFYFSTTASTVMRSASSTALDKVAVVPNPYLLTASWERETAMAGRGERKISFIHLPAVCRIKIFTQNGVLIKALDHVTNGADGSASWDLTTDEGLEVAFGIYVYLVEADEIGHKIGTFAVIN